MIARIRLSALACVLGLLVAPLGGCVGGVDGGGGGFYGYGGYGGGYYEPSGGEFGGFDRGYRVGPYRGGSRPGFGGHGMPGIPTGARGGFHGGGHGGGGFHGGGGGGGGHGGR